MDKAAIKTFAVWARAKLIADVETKARLVGVTERGAADPLPQSTADAQFFDVGTRDYVTLDKGQVRQRDALVATVRAQEGDAGWEAAFHAVVEKTAYTWFNRLIAVRFMEVNDYLPSGVRVLSSASDGKAEPDVVTRPFDADLTYSASERELVARLKDQNRLDELFCLLFAKQCHELSQVLPGLFDAGHVGSPDSYLDLLLSASFTDRDGVVWRLVHDIPERDFRVRTPEDDARQQAEGTPEDEMPAGQVEIIGWLYQYYNTEPKDAVYAGPKKNVKIDKASIPAATQLFTPDWIVRYMVENSLGRLWAEGHPECDLKATWRYYLDEAEQEPQVQEQLARMRAGYAALRPEDIRVIDPCCGSGHILVYMFDVLMQMYERQGWSRRNAVRSVVENNLWGLDIDERAAQLAYFAVMMKACQYDRRFLSRGVQPHVRSVAEGNGVDAATLDYFCKGDAALTRAMNTVVRELHDASEYGSLLTVTPQDWDALYARLDEIEATRTPSVYDEAALGLRPLVQTAQALSQTYHVVCTNPPFMNSSKMNKKLKGLIEKNFADYKSDEFSAFIVRASQMTKDEGFCGFFSPYVWMFIKSYEELREYLYKNATIETLIQFEYSAFEEATVPVCTFAFRNSCVPKKGCYIRLTDFRGGMEVQRQKTLEAIADHACGFYYEQSSDNFSKIPGSPVAYWASESFFNLYINKKISDYCELITGMNTGDNDRYVRSWYEVRFSRIALNKKSMSEINMDITCWIPYSKGARRGCRRNWYGNNEYIVNWREKNHFNSSANSSKHLYLREGISRAFVTTGRFSARSLPQGFLWDVAGSPMFCNDKRIEKYVLAMLCSSVINFILEIVNPTINTQSGDIAGIPLIVNEQLIDEVNDLTDKNINLCRADWDAFETSWDFQRHPLVGRGVSTVAEAFAQWQQECETRFQTLKANEEELNRIFIDIYGLQDELTPEVEDKDVTVRRADLQRDVKSLISYAVGCMFGRYSLDVDGLAYAGGAWDASTYRTFVPDADNCIPVTDEPYFEDDVVARFVEFVRVVYGADTLEENLAFIAQALGVKGPKGGDSREVIRAYFLKDFMADHIKTYQKRPIYWLFDSGKQNGFKALVYMHRWDADTVGNLRVEYLLRLQRVYEREIARMQDVVSQSASSWEVSAATKRLEKLRKQLKEVRDYDARVAHAALSRVTIDLDDGVKVNYAKVQAGSDGKTLGILAKL